MVEKTIRILKKFGKRAVDTGVQLLFPRRCPVCDEIVVPWGAKVCEGCGAQFRRICSPYCMKCGKKLGSEEEFCKDCAEKEHTYIRGRALYEYDSVVRSIYRFKYDGRREYAIFFGEDMAVFLGEFIANIKPDALIPVPLHRKRLAQRGYNQAALLAREIGARMGIPVREKYLLRTRNTAPMKKLNPKERQNNLKKAFIIPKNDVKLKTVIVVDDIYTTGSTIDEIARTLLAAGTKRVYFVALSCGAGI